MVDNRNEILIKDQEEKLDKKRKEIEESEDVENLIKSEMDRNLEEEDDIVKRYGLRPSDAPKQQQREVVQAGS